MKYPAPSELYVNYNFPENTGVMCPPHYFWQSSADLPSSDPGDVFEEADGVKHLTKVVIGNFLKAFPYPEFTDTFERTEPIALDDDGLYLGRTQIVALTDPRLIKQELLTSLQAVVLQEAFPYWRLRLEPRRREDAIVIYPDAIYFADIAPETEIDEALSRWQELVLQQCEATWAPMRRKLKRVVAGLPRAMEEMRSERKKFAIAAAIDEGDHWSVWLLYECDDFKYGLDWPNRLEADFGSPFDSGNFNVDRKGNISNRDSGSSELRLYEDHVQKDAIHDLTVHIYQGWQNTLVGSFPASVDRLL